MRNSENRIRRNKRSYRPTSFYEAMAATILHFHTFVSIQSSVMGCKHLLVHAGVHTQTCMCVNGCVRAKFGSV